jgi:hypothetical protein
MTKYLRAGATKNLMQLHKAADLSLIPKKQISGCCYLHRNASKRRQERKCHVVTQVL